MTGGDQESPERLRSALSDWLFSRYRRLNGTLQTLPSLFVLNYIGPTVLKSQSPRVVSVQRPVFLTSGIRNNREIIAYGDKEVQKYNAGRRSCILSSPSLAFAAPMIVS